MSKITERTNIISIDEIPPVPEVHSSMVSLGELNTYRSFSMSLDELKSMCPNNILKALNVTGGTFRFTSTTTSVFSPNSLRVVFADTFAPEIKKCQEQGLSALDARKTSLLSSISKMDFKTADHKAITEGIKAVMKAGDEKTLNTEIKRVMNQLEVAHTQVFATNLAKACAKASMMVGFKQVEVKQVQGMMEVIATNNIGQRLVSEISVDGKTNNVNASTEIIGITDGSCSLLIQKFNDELKKMGIKIGQEKTTFTGGACQLPYAKIIDQQDKEQRRRTKEQDRLKKLNSISRQKL